MLQLGLWSAVVVFSQLAVVRLYATLVGGVSYFGNLFLLVGAFASACGLMATRLGRFAPLVPAALVVPLGAAVALGQSELVEVIPGEFLWSTVASLKPKAATFDLTLGIVLLALALVPALLLGGAAQGEHLRRTRGGAPAYLVMAFGGLAGGVLFALQNQLLPSVLALACVWSLLVAACFLSGAEGRTRKGALWLLPLLGLVAIAAPVSNRSFFSPYQRVDLQPIPGGYAMLSNGFYISAVSTVPAAKAGDTSLGPTVWAFKSMRPGDRVLVMGSGGGTSDVREALRLGAKHVTAVEIDPVFIRMGLRFDPDQTYRNPKVEVVNTDGRRFLASTHRKFDFVFYPFVDSQTNASNHARFRLDSFLYTAEGLRLAYQHVNEGGILMVAFATGTAWIEQRMFDLLRTATGRPVRVFVREQSIWTLYAVPKGRPAADVSPFYRSVPEQRLVVSDLPVPTDDWPFFYSYQRRVPTKYLQLAGIVLLLFMGLAWLASSRFASGTPQGDDPAGAARRGLKIYAFFSGAAFFFIELRTISALVPVFGSTYLSQALSVIGIIACSIVGALLAQRVRVPRLAVWVALFVAVLVSSMATVWFHPLHGSVVSSGPVLLVALLAPVFFAGYLYLSYVQPLDARAVTSLQHWNLIGGAVGGLAECAVIVVGFQFSAWIALAFYLAGFVGVRAGEDAPTALPPPASGRTPA